MLRKTKDFTTQLEDDVFRDQNGNVVARVLPGGNIVVDKDAAFPTMRMTMSPNIKSIINPVDTTPRYWGFPLAEPTPGGEGPVVVVFALPDKFVLAARKLGIRLELASSPASNGA